MTEPLPEGCRLDQISTDWTILCDPTRFLLCYAPAIRSYLGALVKDAHEADEIAQDFLMRVVQKGGFLWANRDQGRFRDYLKAAVRNAALTSQRRRRHEPLTEAVLARQVEDGALAKHWLRDWQRCLLETAFRALEAHQQRSPGNLFHTVLRVAMDHPDEDSPALAARASALAGRPVRADAFRKQLSRARRVFAAVLVDEVAQTLAEPTPARIVEELIETGLMPYVRDFLSDVCRTRTRRD
jgi:hypothetical protein